MSTNVIVLVNTEGQGYDFVALRNFCTSKHIFGISVIKLQWKSDS